MIDVLSLTKLNLSFAKSQLLNYRPKKAKHELKNRSKNFHGTIPILGIKTYARKC